MKKIVKKIFLSIPFLLLVWVLIYFGKKNSESALEFKTKTPFRTTIVKKSVATGKVLPEDEVEIKPQISGIIDRIYVAEGDFVKTGDLIAKIKIVPNEQALNNAKGRLKNATLNLTNNTLEYNRNKVLFERGVISNQEFNNFQLRYDQAKQDVENAGNDYQIIKVGSAKGSLSANTNIRATVTGTILEIPVKEGDQVIESNNFNAGTTIAAIADLNKMNFEGKVDEAEVGKLKEGTVLEVTIAALEGISYKATLNFVAPKGKEEQGAVLFKIKAALQLNDESYVRAGYSANAELILSKKDDVLAIKESLVQYDRKSEKPYVEILKEKNTFERVDLKLGISDGIDVEVLEGLGKNDLVKVWNKASKEDDEDKKKEAKRRK